MLRLDMGKNFSKKSGGALAPTAERCGGVTVHGGV